MDDYEYLTLDELENQVLQRCVFYTCEKTPENLIAMLKKEDDIRKARLVCYKKLTRTQLKALVNEKCIFFPKYENWAKKKYTLNDYVEIIIKDDEKEDQNKRWKLQNKLRIEKQDSEQIKNDAMRLLLKRQVYQNYKLTEKLDRGIDELRNKENKTIPEYATLVDLLFQRLATKREVTRIIDLKIA